ncbi:MAG: hypothetical protein CO023_05245 [Flavobacteriales bacterium CG_4_9_14_0_2_um_filter_35_242]|nr:MAG: hypothetical protein CO023_05245 [Flavobacteriales bacterium CG_4_9_14_0_2_um_filter_35_242]
MKIDDDILKKTTLCQKNFECLCSKETNSTNEKNCIKKADCFVTEDLFVVECTESACPYFLNYGGYCICSCPTRIEIYKKYGR